jgi:BirA family transcriptional regulator, biotin operon repressor / biotin---[acetyl-CoA-carboxylase] ligase
VGVNDVTPRARLVLERLQQVAGDKWQVRLHPAAESTNALAAADPEDWLLVVADHQTAGRGRLGRAWVTPPGAALTFSAVVDPKVDDEWWPLVPLVAGYAVARAVDGRLKWPNDVLLGGRKVCGILVERVHTPTGPLAVVGIGINVDQTRDELPVDTATSLALETGARDRTELLEAVLYQLRVWKALLRQAPELFVGTYRELCDTVEQQVRVELPGAGAVEGQVLDVDDHGRLVVETGSGLLTVAAGDVVHVRPKE